MRELESPIQLVQAHQPMKVSLAVILLLAGALAACAPARRDTGMPRPSTRPPATPAPTTPGSRVPADPSGRTLPPYAFPGTDGFPRSAGEVSSPPVLNLMEQARDSMSAGRAEQAVASLETALDIEPRNPFVWQQLAQAHLHQQLPDQAENKAQRSNSFARGNPYIEMQNWRVIAAARQVRGDLAGARVARERMQQIQEHIEE